MEDLLNDVSGKTEMAIGALAAGGAWITGKIEAWKAIKSTPLKMVIAAGVFLAIAILLSLITAPFT